MLFMFIMFFSILDPFEDGCFEHLKSSIWKTNYDAEWTLCWKVIHPVGSRRNFGWIWKNASICVGSVIESICAMIYDIN